MSQFIHSQLSGMNLQPRRSYQWQQWVADSIGGTEQQIAWELEGEFAGQKNCRLALFPLNVRLPMHC